MFRFNRIINIKSKFAIKHNSTMPILSYIKDKGTAIPFANLILKPDEYQRYVLYTNLKKGNVEWLREHIKDYPLKTEERETIVTYIKGLKEQPYSVPNLVMSYVATSFGLNTLYYSVTGVLLPTLSIISSPILLSQFSAFLSGLTSAGLIGFNVIGSASIGYGLTIFANELRSPYFNYDEMLRICNDDKTTKLLSN